jgi:chromosome segregation ATPase
MGMDAKEKKLIELVKKNQDLNLKLEKSKLREQIIQKQLTEATNQVMTLQKQITNNLQTKEISADQMEINTLKSNLKQSETHLTEIRNKLQLAKEENTKLNILIRREVGEAFDINRALTDKNYFKPRAEMIESLKMKVRQLENKLKIANELEQNANQSVLSNHSNSVNTTNNQITTNLIPYSDYKREKDAMKKEIDTNKNDIAKLTDQNNKLKLRKNVLEKELKTQKDELTQKIKILIEKSDNDEKLINAMKNELMKKGSNIGSYFQDETFNLNQEINKLRMEIKEKDNYINNITALLIPDAKPGEMNMEALQNNNVTFNNLISRLQELEKENKILKNQSEDAKISEALARENAKLRIKIKDLEDRLCSG